MCFRVDQYFGIGIFFLSFTKLQLAYFFVNVAKPVPKDNISYGNSFHIIA